MRLFNCNSPKLILAVILCSLSFCFAGPIIHPGCEIPSDYKQLRIIDVSLFPSHFLSNHNLEARKQAGDELPDSLLALPKRHTPIFNPSSKATPSLIERRGFSDLAARGYKLVWEKVEVILDSVTAYDYYHTFYYDVLNEIEASNSEPSGSEVIGFVARLVITYGMLELRFDNLPPDQRAANEFLMQFITGLFVLIGTGTIFGTFEVAAIATNSIVLVTLLWVGDRLNNPGLVG